MNRDSYAEKMQIVSKQAGSIAFKATYGKFNRDANLLVIDSLRILIAEAELLLLKDESKQPQPPDFANTMLGEVPHVVTDKSEENSQAVEGATPVVRQNEQTKEVYPHPMDEACQECDTIPDEDGRCLC